MLSRQRIRQFLKQRTGLFLNALFLVAVFLAVSTFQARNMLSAPVLNGPLLRGGSYDIAAAGNRPLLVYFFAPWCKFCAVSSDNLTRLRRLRDDESTIAISATAHNSVCGGGLGSSTGFRVEEHRHRSPEPAARRGA